MKKTALLMLALFSLVYIPFVEANQSGVDWLSGQQDINGAFGAGEGVADQFQNTIEVLSTLQRLDQLDRINLNQAINFVNSTETTPNTRNIAAQLRVNTYGGNEVITQIQILKGHQNINGGFGSLPGFSSSPLDTAFALLAFHEASFDDLNITNQAVAYLLSAQELDGGFSVYGSAFSKVYVTSLVLRALQSYNLIFDVEASINQALAYLNSQRDEFGSWGEDWENAQGLLGVLPVITDIAPYSNTTNLLVQNQLENGSWDNDIYKTSQVLSALYQSEQPLESIIVLTGRLLDAESLLPLQNQEVLFQSSNLNITVSTDSNGLFEFQFVQSVQGNLSIAPEGYGQITTNISLRQGERRHLGEIKLSPDTFGGETPTTAQVRGQVTDRLTGLAIQMQALK